MGRKPRLCQPGGIYHITARRLEGNLLFNNKQDFIRMKSLLRQGAEKHSVELLSYCLMSNHYHLQVQTPEGNISQLMHWINSRYSRYYNFAYDHDGHVFQGRYDCQTITDDSYLLEVNRYIHLNPVRAGLVQLPEQYPYSSYGSYLGYNDWVPLKTDVILSQFVNNTSYRRFVEEGIQGKDNKYLQQAHTLVEEFAVLNNIEVKELLNPQTVEHRIIRRKVVALLASETSLSPKAIGHLTGINSPATLYRLLKK